MFWISWWMFWSGSVDVLERRVRAAAGLQAIAVLEREDVGRMAMGAILPNDAEDRSNAAFYSSRKGLDRLRHVHANPQQARI
jgi:hypothetical protein